MAAPFEHILEQADSYVHDLLTPAQNEYVEQHCARCKICQAALEEAGHRYNALKQLPPSEASPELIQRTLARIAQHDNASAQTQLAPRRWYRRAGWLGAAAAMLFFCLHVYYWTLAPAPYDLRVLCQSKLHAGTKRSLRVELVDPNRGTGLVNVPIKIAMRDPALDQWVHLADFKTDAQGTGQPSFQLPAWKDGTYDLRVSASTGWRPQTMVRSVQLVHSWKLMLTSDRPVYQPGQTIQVRSLALRSLDLKPIAGQTAVFTVADPAGNIIFKQKDVTSAFGISSSACPLAYEILHGPYTIQCQVGDTTSKLTVEVKPYVLPKFKIDLLADQPYYQPGQRVGGKLQAAYFFGKPVADAHVELQLHGNGFAGELVRRELKLRTDAGGTTTFVFPPLPETLKDKDLSLELSAAITDRAGQAQTRKISVPATSQPLRIESILEGGTLVEKLPNRIFFYVHDVIGRPARARIAFSGSDKELTTSALGVASFEFTPTGKNVEWTVRATDDQGRIGRAQVTWNPGQADDDFLFRTDKAVYAGGETMRLTALSALSEPVLVDVHKDGQTLLTAAIPVAKGRGEYGLDLPPELSGTMQLSAYRLGPKGNKGVKTRLVYIRPASQVTITTTLDRPEYQPASVAKLRFQLADPLGKPIPGALSLAAVDEAVFAVLQQSTSTEQSFYTVAPELLQPALHLASWSPPAPDKEEERRTFDQALFALSANVQKAPADREAMIKALLPYVDNSRRIFDVLDDPMFEKLVQNGSVPESVLAVLRNPQGPTTFFATTYPENVRACEATETSLAGVIKIAWIVIGICVGILGMAFLTYRVFKTSEGGAAEACMIGIVLLTCMCFMVPPVQKVREASSRTQMANNLKNIEVAIWGFKDANKKMPGIPEPVAESTTGPRVRQWFPETLLWRPELITDDQGRANLDLPLADSITTWRLTASAVTLDGRLGASQEKIKVFQPFFVEINLPIALTLGDEIAVPVVVYNYLDQPQDVKLDFAAAEWYESQEPGSRQLKLTPGEVRSAHFRLRAKKVGTHELQVAATGSGVADAVKRRIEVLPGGRRIETVWNGNLPKQPTDFSITLPEEAIPGSGRLFVKIYPSQFSQVVEGLDSIFRLPSGCFEQTSSTTYPNVLALDYLQRTKKNSRAIEDKARKYINLGYQRLVSFEVAGGGFDWFGNPPANQALTAYGLMEFEDMARVHDVDSRLIERTRAWLLKKRQADGSWAPEAHVPAGAPGKLGGDELARLSTTAYIAWAVFRTPAPTNDVRNTQQFLLRHRPEDIHDPHVLALVCNALHAMDPSARDAAPYLDRLDALKRSSADGKQIWWEQPLGGRTTFHGSGRSGSVETTALASLAFLQSGKHLASARAALSWIVQQQDSGGTWHSTQATVLALKAMLAGTGSLVEDCERRIEWTWSQGKKETLVMRADQSEVMKLLDLSAHLSLGKQSFTLAEPTGTATNFQVTFRYHVPSNKGDADSPLGLSIRYDRDKLNVGQTIAAIATVANRTKESAPMVMVELPVPAGFTVVPESLANLLKNERIAKYEIQPLAVLVYLRELPAEKSLDLAYGLRAVMPAQVAVPAARAYEYYNPDREGRSSEVRLTVVE